MKLIDTTIAVDHLRGEPAAVELLAVLIDDDEDLVASELVRFELLAGVRDKELRAFEEFCSVLRWAEVSEDVARLGGRLARRYRKSHSGIGAVDYLIAATVIVIDADLLTTNVRHFPMFTKLQPPYWLIDEPVGQPYSVERSCVLITMMNIVYYTVYGWSTAGSRGAS